MTSKTVVAIAVIGGLGLVAFLLAAMMWTGELSKKPMVRACIEVADTHKVREVSISMEPPTGPARKMRLGYETPILHASLDTQREEMETIAKFALEKARVAEWNEDLDLKRQGKPMPQRGPVTLVMIRRTWRSDRGCFKRSDEVTHEWTPPPPPPRR